MQEWYLGWEKVSCLERCPQFRSVLIERERERFHCTAIIVECIYILYILQKLIFYTCKLRVTYIGPPDIFCRDYIYICTYVMVYMFDVVCVLCYYVCMLYRYTASCVNWLRLSVLTSVATLANERAFTTTSPTVATGTVRTFTFYL